MFFKTNSTLSWITEDESIDGARIKVKGSKGISPNLFRKKLHHWKKNQKKLHY